MYRSTAQPCDRVHLTDKHYTQAQMDAANKRIEEMEADAKRINFAWKADIAGLREEWDKAQQRIKELHLYRQNDKEAWKLQVKDNGELRKRIEDLKQMYKDACTEGDELLADVNAANKRIEELTKDRDVWKQIADDVNDDAKTSGLMLDRREQRIEDLTLELARAVEGNIEGIANAGAVRAMERRIKGLEQKIKGNLIDTRPDEVKEAYPYISENVWAGMDTYHRQNILSRAKQELVDKKPEAVG